MIIVKFEYGFGGIGHTESCVGFDTMQEAREFAINAINEICDEVRDGVAADNAVLRVWDAEVDSELIADVLKGDRLQ